MLQFTDEQIEAIGDALRLAHNGSGGEGAMSGGVALATMNITTMLEHGNPDFDREAFLDRVYTTTVTRPDETQNTLSR